MNTFDNDSKAPYYSIRVRVGNVTSPKPWIGYLDRSIEITYGNQETKLIRNLKDAGDLTEQRSLMEDLETKWVGLTEWAKQHDLKFVDQVKKDEHGDPVK